MSAHEPFMRQALALGRQAEANGEVPVGAVVVIDGEIVNSTAEPRQLPRLRVSLRDGGMSDLASKVIDPPVATLAPGTTARFSATFEHPSIAATRADVSFVTN